MSEEKKPEQPKKPVITPKTPQSFTKVVIDITLGERPKTHPLKQGNGMEGYPKSAQILQVLRKTTNCQEAIDKINHQIDWKNGGVPNHHVYWVLTDLVKGKGAALGIDAVYEPVYHQGRIINYVMRVKFS